MSGLPFFVVLWFVVTTLQKTLSSTNSSVCRRGSVNVSCNLRADCSAGDQKSTEFNPVYLQLVKDGKVINSLESFVNATFNVQFANLQGRNTIAFECVWKRNHTRFCEQKVTVDLQELPALLQKVAISVVSFDTRMHFSKMIVVSFNDSQKKIQRNESNYPGDS